MTKYNPSLDEILDLYSNGCNDIECAAKTKHEKCRTEAKSALYDLILKEVVGETIPLNAHIDDELLRYVPDMKERSLEVTGVSSAFTTLYTRALVQQVQQEMRNKLKELFDE